MARDQDLVEEKRSGIRRQLRKHLSKKIHSDDQLDEFEKSISLHLRRPYFVLKLSEEPKHLVDLNYALKLVLAESKQLTVHEIRALRNKAKVDLRFHDPSTSQSSEQLDQGEFTPINWVKFRKEVETAQTQ